MRFTPRRTLVVAAACLAAALGGCTKEKVCASDQALCGDTCSRLSTDPANCGACGNACGQGQVCTASACVFGTAQNCGAFARTCGTGETCRSGRCIADLYLACFDTNEVREATSALGAAGSPIATAAGPVSLAWLGDALAVADSLNGTVEILRFDLPAVRSAATITIATQGRFGPDLEFITAANGLLYVSNAGANVLDVLDPIAMKVVDEIPLGDGTNPAGILVVGTKAYVALNSTNEVVDVDVSASATCASIPCGAVTSRIPLPPSLAGAGGAPLPTRLALVNGKLYVTLTNLKFVPAPVFVTPAGDGALAVVDVTSDTLVTTAGSFPVDLGSACQDPGDIVVQGQTLYVTCGFPPIPPATGVTGGAIVPVDVSSGSPVVRAPLALPTNAPGHLVFCGTSAYAGDRASGSVLRYDSSSNSVTATQELCAPSNTGAAFVAALACGI